MPKLRLRRLVAVFEHGQSLRTKPLCYIPREDAAWWVASGGAEKPRAYSGCIILNKIKSAEMLGVSARMGPSVSERVAEGSRFHIEITMRWRFGFVEPPTEPEAGRARSLHFPAPAPSEA